MVVPRKEAWDRNAGPALDKSKLSLQHSSMRISIKMRRHILLDLLCRTQSMLSADYLNWESRSGKTIGSVLHATSLVIKPLALLTNQSGRMLQTRCTRRCSALIKRCTLLKWMQSLSALSKMLSKTSLEVTGRRRLTQSSAPTSRMTSYILFSFQGEKYSHLHLIRHLSRCHTLRKHSICLTIIELKKERDHWHGQMSSIQSPIDGLKSKLHKERSVMMPSIRTFRKHRQLFPMLSCLEKTSPWIFKELGPVPWIRS